MVLTGLAAVLGIVLTSVASYAMTSRLFRTAETGLAITVYACLNCGRRKPAEPEPRPLTARAYAVR